jgi:hypothetical protein
MLLAGLLVLGLTITASTARAGIDTVHRPDGSFFTITTPQDIIPIGIPPDLCLSCGGVTLVNFDLVTNPAVFRGLLADRSFFRLTNPDVPGTQGQKNLVLTYIGDQTLPGGTVLGQILVQPGAPREFDYVGRATDRQTGQLVENQGRVTLDVVPLPSAVLAMGAGLAALGGLALRRRR